MPDLPHRESACGTSPIAAAKSWRQCLDFCAVGSAHVLPRQPHPEAPFAEAKGLEGCSRPHSGPRLRLLERPSRPLRGASGGGGRSRITKETPARRFRQFHIRIQARAFTQSALPTRDAQGAHIIPQAVLLFAAGVSAPDLVSPPPAGSPTRGGGSAGTPGDNAGH